MTKIELDGEFSGEELAQIHYCSKFAYRNDVQVSPRPGSLRWVTELGVVSDVVATVFAGISLAVALKSAHKSGDRWDRERLLKTIGDAMTRVGILDFEVVDLGDAPNFLDADSTSKTAKVTTRSVKSGETFAVYLLREGDGYAVSTSPQSSNC